MHAWLETKEHNKVLFSPGEKIVFLMDNGTELHFVMDEGVNSVEINNPNGAIACIPCGANNKIALVTTDLEWRKTPFSGTHILGQKPTGVTLVKPESVPEPQPTKTIGPKSLTPEGWMGKVKHTGYGTYGGTYGAAYD